MEVRQEHQLNPVADRVGALVAVTRPIVAGLLHSLSGDMVLATGIDRNMLPLKLVASLHKAGDGDCGIAFEYAVHDAILRGEEVATERVADALKRCRISQGDPRSILFAVEKSGGQQLISTELGLLTDDSRVLSGEKGQPVKLKKHLSAVTAAFNRRNARLALPQSISGLWKADLFLGSTVKDHWVGTTVKINPDRLEGERGLRIAVVPTYAGKSDAIRVDEQKNLVVCPLPHDGSFMETFYVGWRIIQALCATTFQMPKESLLPSPPEREVARMWIERRDYPVSDVLEAMSIFAQPELLLPEESTVSSIAVGDSPGGAATNTIVSPMPLSDGSSSGVSDIVQESIASMRRRAAELAQLLAQSSELREASKAQNARLRDAFKDSGLSELIQADMNSAITKLGSADAAE